MILGFFKNLNSNKPENEMDQQIDFDSFNDNTERPKAKSILLYGYEEEEVTDNNGCVLKDAKGNKLTKIVNINDKGLSLLYLENQPSPIIRKKKQQTSQPGIFTIPDQLQFKPIQKQQEPKTSQDILKKMGNIFNCINKSVGADSPEGKSKEDDLNHENLNEISPNIDPRLHRLANLSQTPYITQIHLPNPNRHAHSSLIFNREPKRLHSSQLNEYGLSIANSNDDHNTLKMISSKPILISTKQSNSHGSLLTQPSLNHPKTLTQNCQNSAGPSHSRRERHLPPLQSEVKFKNSKKVQIVIEDYSHKFLTTFPQGHILFPPHLHTLILSHNKLSIIPEIIYNLHIKVLKISHNKIKEISDKINKLTTLEHLDISYNELQKISVKITMLTNLKSLNVENNKLTQIPKQMGSLMNLEELNISRNPLTILTNQLLWLKKLRVFKVSHSFLDESGKEITKAIKQQAMH